MRVVLGVAVVAVMVGLEVVVAVGLRVVAKIIMMSLVVVERVLGTMH